MRRALTALLVAATVLLFAAPAGAAVVDVLTTGSVGGPNVPVGDVIHGNLKPGTKARFVTASGGGTGVFCDKSSFTATVLTNPPAGGVATLSLTSLMFGMCTTNLPGLT